MRGFLRRAGDLLAELKRRKVYQAAAVYALVVVGALELADLLIPATRLPGWADELFLGLAIVGFPLVAVLAWVFDLTEEGVRRTPERSQGSSPSAEAPASGLAQVEESAHPAPGPLVVPQRPDSPVAEGPAEEEGPADPRVVAVLPFENLTGAAEAEPFVVGLHDDLLIELSRASALTVISRGSVRGYRDSTKPARSIARELGAGTLILGGVQMAGSRVRLNVQLIDPATESNRWAERYDRELSAETIFELQSELARRIMEELQAELTAVEESRTGEAPTADLDAYRFYVRGRSLQEQWSEENFHRAVGYFRRAIERDPDYALAWAGLADTQSLLRWYALPVVPDAPGPEDAAARALELDDQLAEAHLSRAIVLSSREHTDAPGALEALERAVTLRPNLATAYIWMSWLRLQTGRPAEAVEPGETAVELDPLNPPARVFLAEAYLANGLREEALAEAVRGREIQPDHPLSHFVEALVLLHLGRPDRAQTALDRTRELVPPGGQAPTRGQILALEGVARVLEGDEEGARAVLEGALARSDAVGAGLLQAALGDAAAAVRTFGEVEEWGQISNEYLRYFFPEILAPVRADPGYAELLARAEASWGVA